MITVLNCPVCNSDDYSDFFEIEKFPYFIAPVNKQDKELILEKYKNKQLYDDLNIVVCNRCFHIYLKKLPDNKIISEVYSKYYSYPSALEGNIVPSRDDNFLSTFEKKIKTDLESGQKHVLEIGCFDGYVLYKLKEKGFSVSGCDPSNGADIGKKFGIDIKKDFFKVEDYEKDKLKYDLIIFRHFLEHLSNPVDFLVSLKKILNPEGLIIFEVPNVEFYLKNGTTSVFSFQHLQYFSEESIINLLKQAGLKLKNLAETGENIIMVCCEGEVKDPSSSKTLSNLCNSFRNNFEKEKETFKKIISSFSDEGVVLWGAGGFFSSALEIYAILDKDIRFIVDSDENKWSMEFLKYNIPIKSPDFLKQENHGYLVISSMYAKDIIKRLSYLEYDKPVITLYPRIKLFPEVKNAKENQN